MKFSTVIFRKKKYEQKWGVRENKTLTSYFNQYYHRIKQKPKHCTHTQHRKKQEMRCSCTPL